MVEQDHKPRAANRLIASLFFWLVPFLGGVIYGAVEMYATRDDNLHGFEQGILGFAIGVGSSFIFALFLTINFLVVLFRAVPPLQAGSSKRLYLSAGIAGLMSLITSLGTLWLCSLLPWVGMWITWLGSKNVSETVWAVSGYVVVMGMTYFTSWFVIKMAVRMGQLQRFRDPFRCGHCGYNLHGLEDARCPECFAEFDSVGDDG